MTTDNNSVRELNELINLGTYQGMTDEEIERVIAFKVDMEVMRRVNNGTNAANTAKMETLIAEAEESRQQAMTVLQSIRERKPVLHTVGGDNE